MKKNWVGIIGTVVFLIVIMQLFSGAKHTFSEKDQPAAEEPLQTAAPTESEETEEMTKDILEEKLPSIPASVLFYGEILEIRTEEDGSISQLVMESPRDGCRIMNLGSPTCYINSGERKSFEADELQKGDRIYVFHSLASTMSLPPQSPAYVVVKNIPMDAGCPMYHQIEEITEKNGELLLAVSNGKTLKLSAEDHLLSYDGHELEHSELKAGQRIMGWYWDQGEEIIRASHLMILPEMEQESA